MDPFRSVKVSSVIQRNLVFISGKGGVGKTSVSQALSGALSRGNRRVLWVTFEDPKFTLGETTEIGPSLWHLNCEATRAFEDYASLKIGVPKLTHLFVQNKVIQYLAKAAPGIHELVLLGKVWNERAHYDHVVVDMPSTGYGLAMFRSMENFARLFKGGPVHRDAESMLETFHDPLTTGHLILALPEEMPLREALELNEFLVSIFPRNPSAFLVNRIFPKIPLARETATPDQWSSPVAKSIEDYVVKRSLLENHNMRLWKDREYSELKYVPPTIGSLQHEHLISHLSEQILSEQILCEIQS